MVRFLKMIFATTALLWALDCLGQAVVAKKAGVQVFAEANKTGKVLRTLEADEVVDAKDRKGMFWEVKIDAGVGYVSVLDVKPKSGDSGFSAAIRSAVQNGREEDDSANVRARSAVMGVRGLDENSETEFAGNARPNLRMVYNMEGFLVQRKKIDELGDLVAKEIEKKMGENGK